MIPFFLFAQPVKKSRILFLLDASSSMTYNWNAKYTRFDIASNILLKIIDSFYALNNEVEFAVRAYGTQYPAQDKNCTDTRLEVPFNIQNVAQINTRLKNMQPLGFSPIAYSLRQAADNELSDARLYDYSIIFITDGGESCNGDVCNTFREFLEKRIKVKPYIIGLDRNEQLNQLYDCMGNFIKVADPDDIDKAVKLIVDANRPLLDKPKVLNLPTVFAKPAVIKDSAAPAVKPPVQSPVQAPDPKPVRSASIFPRLKMLPYQVRINDQVIMKPAYIIQAKATTVTLRFNTDVPPPPAPQVVARKTDVFPKLSAPAYRFKNEVKALMTAKPNNFRVKEKAILRFETEVPAVVRTPDIFPLLKAAKYKFTAVTSVVKLSPKRSDFDRSKAAVLRFDIEKPVLRLTNVMPLLKMPKIWVANTVVTLKNLKPVAYNNKQTAILRFEVEQKKKPVLSALRPEKFPMRYSYAYRLPQLSARKPTKEMAIIRFTSAELGVVKRNDSVPKKFVPPPEPEKLDAEFTVALENSEETKVQVFFESRAGKKYPAATPEIVFKEQGSNSVITSFRRQVSGNEPVPQKIAAGKYNVIVTGYNDLYVNNVTIVPNKLNKVTIKVSDGTLAFAYVGNRNRPVEYNAIVNRRFAAGATVLQKCVDKLTYEPGTYYVEISTLPASKFSIDMSFGALYELQIPEPGTLQISNTEPIGKVQLQYEHGEMFEVFYTMNLNGNIAAQTLMLQPGRYKIIFPVDPKMPQMGTKTQDFIIRSNRNSLVELQ
ncbi:MAG: VWA domain-containing protein [Chitinophagaceae bacterium]|nr:VWA domain-containing protein [Chitinophagaceae bacterium]